MSNIKETAKHLQEPTQSICIALIEFYETMKKLETDPHRGGKQATYIVMTVSYIEDIFSNLKI